ncbi:unnamed protein product [Urochloa decumbens]|uniref:Uncharacterized protein n=1 Tax=Urochloa decumbens TaxID=240449 RepID=A0ABC8W785_9POAL
MALVHSNDDTDLRIYKPSLALEYPSREESADHRRRLKAKIHNAYRKALERLTVNRNAARCSLAARVLAAGFCFGLLDPASNVVVNTLITPCRPVAAAELEDMERRSQDGMVTFLTRLFPYLADCEAERYLLLAGADLLVAARDIATDRRMKRLGLSERATEEALRMALKCAALAAGHPDPDRLVGAWLAVSSRLDDAACLVAKVRRRSPSSTLRNLSNLLDGPAAVPTDGRRGDLLRAWQLAASLRQPQPRRVPLRHTTSTPLVRTLLDAIHGLYLQALARLPAGELRSRFHRSLLKGGHCYGPFDPVSNIIVNTVWYDAAFPRTHELELDMICTLSLHRIENRSLYGLVSFLCTRYHHLDFHGAVRCLLDADANLLLAADAASRTGRRRTSSKAPPRSTTGVEEALRAAAVAGHHPNPDAQVNMLASCKQKLGSAALSLLQCSSQLLSSEHVRELARRLLSPEPSCCSEQQPLLPFPLEEYVRKHTRISNKVMEALSSHAPMYELHVICGVNEHVFGPLFCPGGSKFAPHKCYRSHVNFLATLKGTREAPPVLFFAELSNDDEHKGVTCSVCCPVSAPPPCADRIRCLYCDYVGIRIVHPSEEEFHGGELEFEKMVCGGDPCDDEFDPNLSRQLYTNMTIVRNSRLVANEIGSLEEDRLYADSFDDQPSADVAFWLDYMMDDDDYSISGDSTTDVHDVDD